MYILTAVKDDPWEVYFIIDKRLFWPLSDDHSFQGSCKTVLQSLGSPSDVRVFRGMALDCYVF